MEKVSTYTVTEFLNEFLFPPKGHAPVDIKAKIEHWLEVANHPELFVTDGNAYEAAYKRRLALNNLRRLIQRHPAIAQQIHEERASSATEAV